MPGGQAQGPASPSSPRPSIALCQRSLSSHVAKRGALRGVLGRRTGRSDRGDSEQSVHNQTARWCALFCGELLEIGRHGFANPLRTTQIECRKMRTPSHGPGGGGFNLASTQPIQSTTQVLQLLTPPPPRPMRALVPAAAAPPCLVQARLRRNTGRTGRQLDHTPAGPSPPTGRRPSQADFTHAARPQACPPHCARPICPR